MRLLPLFAALVIGILVAQPPAHADVKRPLRLMTYNVNYGNPDPQSALDAIARADADVVLLQEITTEWQHLLRQRFASAYPHTMFRIHHRAAGGLAVLSKVPIQTEEVLASPERGWFPAERLVLDTPFGALQILNVHLRPAIEGGSWIKGFMTTPPKRRREIAAYWKHVDASLPTIVAGDFNEDPTGLAVSFLAKQGLARVDTKGPTTWHYQVTNHGTTSDMLKIDIDHVMIDRRLSGRDGTVLDEGRSDHRPVIVTIEPRS